LDCFFTVGLGFGLFLQLDWDLDFFYSWTGIWIVFYSWTGIWSFFLLDWDLDFFLLDLDLDDTVGLGFGLFFTVGLGF
jgi:hypothetical protein